LNKPPAKTKKFKRSEKMSSRFLSVVTGVALAASVTSAFAFDAVLSRPKGLHVQPCHHSAVIEVLPATAVINIIGCRYGWCQATAPNGATGFVHTPVLLGAVPAPEPVAPVAAPAPVAAAPVAAAPVVASY
jgi:hypothetical protein